MISPIRLLLSKYEATGLRSSLNNVLNATLPEPHVYQETPLYGPDADNAIMQWLLYESESLNDESRKAPTA